MLKRIQKVFGIQLLGVENPDPKDGQVWFDKTQQRFLFREEGQTKPLESGESIPTGVVQFAMRTTAPEGWLPCFGETIGNSSSGATYTGADFEGLFTHLWTNFADADLPIFNSDGSSSTRGVDAETDWAADKRLSLLDLRGRDIISLDDMGSGAANRVTTGGSGVAADTIGKSGGSEVHTLTTAQLPSHTHNSGTLNITGSGGHNHSYTNRDTLTGRRNSTGSDTNYGDSTENTGSTSHTHPSGNFLGTSSSAGSGSAHNNLQPSIVMKAFIKV